MGTIRNSRNPVTSFTVLRDSNLAYKFYLAVRRSIPILVPRLSETPPPPLYTRQPLCLCDGGVDRIYRVRVALAAEVLFPCLEKIGDGTRRWYFILLFFSRLQFKLLQIYLLSLAASLSAVPAVQRSLTLLLLCYYHD